MRSAGSKRSRLIAACTWSAALHAGVLWLVAGMSWTPAEREPRTQVEVVWLENPPTPAAVLPEREPEEPAPDLQREPDEPAPQPDEPQRRSEPAAPNEPEPAAPDEPEPDEPDEPEPDEPEPDEPESAASTDEREVLVDAEAPVAPAEPIEPAVPVERDAESPPRDDVIDRVDLEEASRRAREEIREQRERERNYVTFSREDDAEPGPLGETGPSESIFEAAERASRGGPSVMSPGKARTHFGRRLAELCNALTGGGMSLMGFATICADEGESAKLFAALKPAYLRSRPVCTEVEGNAVVAEVEIDGMVAEVESESVVAQLERDGTAAEGDNTVIKCRLVLKDE